MLKPLRAAWNEFPDVLIHAGESVVKKHPRYHAAKSGDADAAKDLVDDTINDDQVEFLLCFLAGKTPILLN